MTVSICAIGLAASLWAQSRPATQPATSADAVSFQTARQAFLEGDYDRAKKHFEELAAEDAVAAACGRSAVDFQLSDYESGIERLLAVEKSGARSAEWHACLAELLESVGRCDEAMKHNRAALDIAREHYRARWQLGRLLEMLGRTKEAIDVYRPFEEIMTTGPLPKGAEELTCLGLGFLRYSVLTRHPELARRTKHALTEVIQEAFEYADTSYFPARLACAQLLLIEHNLNEAKSDFETILSKNPNVPAAHIGLASIALEQWDFEEARKQADAALRIAPHFADAHLLLVQVSMMERSYKEAGTEAQKALDVNPNSIEGLALLGAAQLCDGDAAASRATESRIETINPNSAVHHFTFGKSLSFLRQSDDAERRLLKAIEADPTWVTPRTELGRVYLETGEEEKARKVLDAAFELDRFNAQTHEVLDLLERIEKFNRVESEHFIVKSDKQQDALLGQYFADALESFYQEICDEYAFHPDRKTIVEVFPDHMGFSVRISGRPFIATVGACSGRVIAMSAPRGVGGFGRFNWADVVRHEFTHTVTLAATNNHIPRWMTEGLAVYQETPRQGGTQRFFLTNRTRADELFPVASIDWGFMRPKGPNDTGDAYAQSEWIIEYIIERYGKSAITKMLRRFRDGVKQETVFRDVLHLDESSFDREFKKWAIERVREWGLPESIWEEPEVIEARIMDEGPTRPCLVELAGSFRQDGKYDRAEETAEKLLMRDENDPQALEVMAACKTGRMHAAKENADRRKFADHAVPFLQRLLEVEPENVKAAQYLGWAEQERENPKEAQKWLKKYAARFPEDPDAYRRLASIHRDAGNRNEELKTLETLLRCTNNEPVFAMRLGRLYFERKDYPRAARWYLEAIYTDPYDAESHEALGETYRLLGDPERAERELEIAGSLQGASPASQPATP